MSILLEIRNESLKLSEELDVFFQEHDLFTGMYKDCTGRRQGKSSYQTAKDMNLHTRTVNRIIARYQETGSYEDRPRGGRPRTASTPVNKRKIKERIKRTPNSRKNSNKEMGKAIGISDRSIRRILKEDLNMKSRKMAKGRLLNDDAINEKTIDKMQKPREVEEVAEEEVLVLDRVQEEVPVPLGEVLILGLVVALIVIVQVVDIMAVEVVYYMMICIL
uniref:Transposase n=1 Tax=Acrobeloides nanus TaxID=290746 RepID=A0A914DW91_9BILA